MSSCAFHRLSIGKRTWSYIAILVLESLCSVGCGQSGTSGSAIKSCDFVRSPIAMDKRAKLGTTPREVLGFSAKQFKEPLRWTDQKAAVVSPASVDEVEITIEYSGGSMMEVTSEKAGCDPSLEIDVSVDVSSSDGALAEHRVSTLTAPSEDTAEIALTIQTKEIEGKLRLEPSADRWSISAIIFLVHLTEAGSSGEIRALSKRDEGGEPPTEVDRTLAGGEFEIATW